MKKLQQQKGFTLVELAIVLVIIGLLIGGILKGQQLMENSAITATVAQIKAIEAATTSFRDAYGQLPGDLNDAASKITDCTQALCEDGNRPGDGIIGNAGWDMVTYQPGPGNDPTALGAGCTPGSGCQYGFETLLYWHSLEKAGLITAVKGGALDNSNPAFGNTIPGAEIAGGFWVGYSDGSLGATPLGTTYTLLGSILTLVGEPSTDLDGTQADNMPVTAAVAATIDRKLDDGLPASGSVQAWGYDGNAAEPGACTDDTSGTELYNESNERLDCGVHITIQQ